MQAAVAELAQSLTQPLHVERLNASPQGAVAALAFWDGMPDNLQS